MSRSHIIIAVATALILMAVGLVLKPGDEKQAAAPPQRDSESRTEAPSRPPSSPPGKKGSPREMQPVDPLELESAIEQLAELATEQSPSAVPKIAAYLDDPSVEIRSAALESMIQLGETAGIPYLLKAADSAVDPEEAKALREGAGFLELPPEGVVQPVLR